MDLQEQLKIILKAAKIRSAIVDTTTKKNEAVRLQKFDEAAVLRDRERRLFDKYELVNEEMYKIYDELFPEEAKDIDLLPLK